jgi:type IV secretory pathway VirB4 component
MATQSLTDAANSGIFDVIVESTATKLLLPNVYARDEDTANLYKRMGLNPYLTHIINIYLKTICCTLKNLRVALHLEK